jgi:hypothetical protein
MRLPLLAAAAALLVAGPARAITNFDVRLDKTFGTYTGVEALFKFDFRAGATPGQFILDLTVLNDSPSYVTDASLVGFAFDIPTSVSSFTYNPNSSNFLQATSTSIHPASDFNFCASTSNNPRSIRCDSGSTLLGLDIGESALVSFVLDSSAPDADFLGTSFRDLFNTVVFSSPTEAVHDTVVLAARFQGVNSVYDGQTITGGSDKLTGAPHGETTSVPGPLPLLGAAAAFRCSRKLRSRIAR